jgi:hypothetical protein
MLLWYTGMSVLLVANVFRSTGVDYRIIAAGALVPLAVDAPFGHQAYAHTLLFAVAVLVVVMALGHGRPRLVQRRLLCLPIGVFSGLVLSGAWSAGEVFWWPLFGTDIGAESLLAAWWVILIEELVGLVAWWWVFGQFDLYLPGPRAEFKRTGRLRETTGPA